MMMTKMMTIVIGLLQLVHLWIVMTMMMMTMMTIMMMNMNDEDICDCLATACAPF